MNFCWMFLVYLIWHLSRDGEGNFPEIEAVYEVGAKFSPLAGLPGFFSQSSQVVPSLPQDLYAVPPGYFKTEFSQGKMADWPQLSDAI